MAFVQWVHTDYVQFLSLIDIFSDYLANLLYIKINQIEYWKPHM